MFREPLPVAKGGCCIVVAHLIVHPKGTLLWDTGVVPDAQLGSGAPGTQMGGKRSLKDQLAEIGYSAKDITYLALSHFHFDHTGNANDYQGSTWIVQQPEREAMFAGKPFARRQCRAFHGVEEQQDDRPLEHRRVRRLRRRHGRDQGGCRPHAGPSGLVLKLPKTGPVMLAGDLYHFREERSREAGPHDRH